MGASRAKGVVATPVDGEAVRAGALDSADVLVMPGGSSVDESKTLGPEGREKVKAFFRVLHVGSLLRRGPVGTVPAGI